MKNLLSPFLILTLSYSLSAQVISSKECDSLRVLSLEYPIPDIFIDSLPLGVMDKMIKINLVYNANSFKNNYLNYPVWSILNEKGDTLGRKVSYTYAFYFDGFHNNLIPRSKLVVDSQTLAQQTKLYIHLHDSFGNGNSSLKCILPFEQNPLGIFKNESENIVSNCYPNPVSSILHVTEENDQVDLLDQNGKLVFSSHHVSQLNLSEVRKGIYTLKTTLINGSISFEKIIVE